MPVIARPAMLPTPPPALRVLLPLLLLVMSISTLLILPCHCEELLEKVEDRLRVTEDDEDERPILGKCRAIDDATKSKSVNLKRMYADSIKNYNPEIFSHLRASDQARQINYEGLFSCQTSKIDCPLGRRLQLFGEPKTGTTWVTQTILALFELACEEFQGWLPDHVESIKTNNGSRCFYQCVNEVPYMYAPGTWKRQPSIYRWQHYNKHEIPIATGTGHINNIQMFMMQWMRSCVTMTGSGNQVEWTRISDCVKESKWSPVYTFKNAYILMTWRDPRVVLVSGAHFVPKTFFTKVKATEEDVDIFDSQLIPLQLERTNYKQFAATLMWMLMRDTWYRIGLIGSDLYPIIYEAMRMDFESEIQRLAKQLGIEKYVTADVMAELTAKTSIQAMRALEERGGVVEHAVQQLPKIQSGLVWINQTQLPQDTIETLNRIMCKVWPERLYSRYIKC